MAGVLELEEFMKINCWRESAFDTLERKTTISRAHHQSSEALLSIKVT